MKKKIYLYGMILLCIPIAYYTGTLDRENNSPIKPDIEYSSQEPEETSIEAVSAVEVENAKLKARNSELQEKNQALEKLLNNHKEAEASFYTDNNVAQNPNHEEKTSPQERLKVDMANQIGDHSQYVGKTYEEMMQNRKDGFNQEPVDTDWAHEYEKKLNEAIYNDPALSNYAIQSLECKSERCRILVYLGEKDTANKFGEILTRKLASGENGLERSGIFTNFSEETGVATIFLGRDSEVQLF